MKLNTLARYTLAAVLITQAVTSHASQAQHTGASDPATEGFNVATFQGSAITGAVFNDAGVDAWQMATQATITQYSYLSGAFSQQQKIDFSTNGFNLSLQARVLQGAEPTYYDTTYGLAIAGATFDNGTRRYSVFLSLDSNGDTVAILPTWIESYGPGRRIQTQGTHYTLTGLGNGYHNFSLLYDPAIQSASLYIDGVEKLSDYNGYNNFVSDFGIGFSVFSGGVARYASVTISAVPEPTSLWLALCGVTLIAVSRKCKVALTC
jgi:hypothetical protein